MDTGIYIDYDNLHLSLKDYYSEFNSTDIIERIVDAEMKDLNKIRLIKAFCDFEQSYDEISSLQKTLVELRHINSVGRGKSNASDIGLSIDVIKSLFNDSGFDKYVIVSSDSDMLPLLLELRYFGKNVVLYYLEANINQTYLNMLCSNSNIETISIESILDIDVYNPINVENLSTDQISNFMKTIKETIEKLRSKFGGKEVTSISFNKLKEALTENHNDLESEDANKLLYKLSELEYIYSTEKEFETKDGSRKLTTWDVKNK